MNLMIPDDPALKDLAESDIRLDLACALYASGRLSRSVSARLAGMDRFEFDEELFKRHISAYTEETLAEDRATMNELFPK